MLLAQLCKDPNFRNYNKIEELIKNGADVNYVPPKSRLTKKTPLVYAIENKNYDLIIILIKSGANVNFRTNRGKNKSIFEFLLQQDFSKDNLQNILIEMYSHGLIVDKWDFSLTFKYNIHHDNIKLIVDNIKEICPETLVRYSSKKYMHYTDIFKYIYDKKNIFDFNEYLTELIHRTSSQLIQWIYYNIPDINKDNIFKLAISCNKYKFANLLIKDGNIPDDALVLLAKKVNYKYIWRGYNNTNCYLNIDNRSLTLAKKLIKLGISVNAKNKKGMTALMLAFKYNNWQYAEFLLNNGADPRLSKINYVCLIFYNTLWLDRIPSDAIKKCLDLLKTFNIDVTSYVDEYDNSILQNIYYSVFDNENNMFDKIHIVIKFIANLLNKYYPIDYNHQNKLGKTFLHSLCDNPCVKLTHVLHVPLNTIQDINGNTPKHIYANTIIRNHLFNDTQLWGYLGDVKIKNNDGKTPSNLLKDESDLIKSNVFDKFNIS